MCATDDGEGGRRSEASSALDTSVGSVRHRVHELDWERPRTFAAGVCHMGGDPTLRNLSAASSSKILS